MATWPRMTAPNIRGAVVRARVRAATRGPMSATKIPMGINPGELPPPNACAPDARPTMTNVATTARSSRTEGALRDVIRQSVRERWTGLSQRPWPSRQCESRRRSESAPPGPRVRRQIKPLTHTALDLHPPRGQTGRVGRGELFGAPGQSWVTTPRSGAHGWHLRVLISPSPPLSAPSGRPGPLHGSGSLRPSAPPPPRTSAFPHCRFLPVR